MVHLLGQLGIDLWLLLAQVVNFMLLLVVLNRFVYKPLVRRIEADEAALEAAKHAATELQKKEQQFTKKEEQYELHTKQRAREIIAEAEQVAADIRARTEAETKQEKEAVLAQINQRLREVTHD